MKYAAIFDMDGVLVDSSQAHFAAWSELGRRISEPFSRAFFDQTFGMHNAQIFPLWLGDLSAERIQELSLEKEALYREAAAGEVQALEGAVELVRALDEADFALAVGSSGPRANVELILRILGVAECFDALSTGDDVTHGKPHPEVFSKAAERLGLEPARCLVLEDAPQGIEAALRAHMRVLAVTSSRPAADLQDAHRIVHSLREVGPAELAALIDS